MAEEKRRLHKEDLPSSQDGSDRRVEALSKQQLEYPEFGVVSLTTEYYSNCAV